MSVFSRADVLRDYGIHTEFGRMDGLAASSLSMSQTSELSRTGLASMSPAPAIDLNRLSGDLVDVFAMKVQGKSVPGPVEGFQPLAIPMIYDEAGRVLVQVTSSDVNSLEKSLVSYGFVTSAAMPGHHFVEGYLPVEKLIDATALWHGGLLGIQGVARPMSGTGSVLSEADYTLQAARTRATSPPGVDGTGVTIGVLSDSYNNLGGAAAGIASGDLPSSLVFNRDLSSGGSDEGRAMIELVHDIAPGSPKAFATAFTGQANFAQNIRDLAKPVASGGAGAKVITDDVFYFAEPMFQDGIIAQAIDDVVTNDGVSYFALAGNLSDQAYENTSPTFVTTTIAAISGSPAKYLQFSPGFFTQNVTLNAQSFIANLQWSDPFYTSGGVKTNLDFFVLAGGSVIASSTGDNVASNTPYEQVAIQGTGTGQLVVRLTAGDDPARLKWVNYGANNSGPVTIQFATQSPTVIPHSAAVNALSVAASPMFDQKTVESFSSKGPATILFDAAGNAIAPSVRAKPDIMANDAVSNTFFGSAIGGLPNRLFFGTSAAAPNAAAVGALVIQANPSFTPAQVYSRMKSTADPNVTGGIDKVGAGLVDAYRAVVGLPTAENVPVIDGFESGVLTQKWDVYNSGSGRTTVSSANIPATGSNHLVFDSLLPGGFATPSFGESILHSNLAGKSNVKLTFDAKMFGSETIQAMPASFTNHNNSDGVAFSVDGTNWFRLDDLSTLSTSYQSFVIDLSAAAVSAGVTLSADTQIKFQRFSSSSGQAPAVGLAFDNVVASALTTVTNVTSTNADGAYGTGSIIDITVGFSAAVNVTGLPKLALATIGGPPAVADYFGGSGTSTLTFRYIVSAGQTTTDLDYASSSALSLNGGTIVDAVSNSASLTLPAPGSAGSLGANKSIVIDTTAPTVVAYKVLFGSQSHNLVGSARVILPWQIKGIQVVFSEPITTGNLNSLTGLSNTGFSGLGTNTLTWAINPLTSGNFVTNLLGTGANALKDAAGNALTDGTGFAQNLKVLYGDFNQDGAVTSADMVGVNKAIASPYNIFADINGDGVVDLNDVQVVRTRNGKKLV